MTARRAVDPAAVNDGPDVSADVLTLDPETSRRVARVLERMAADPAVADVLARLSAVRTVSTVKPVSTVHDGPAAVDDVEAAR